MFAVPCVIARRRLGQQAVRSFAASPFGGDVWRHDKNAFKTLILRASQGAATTERRTLFGYLAISFGDVDADKDGYITPEEFDVLLETVAAEPRRFGLAPSWVVEYGGDVAKRSKTRRAVFDQINADPASEFAPQDRIGLSQFIAWAFSHIFMKAKTIDLGRVDLAHLGQYSKADFLDYMEEAVKDPSSIASVTVYNFLLTVFLEADEGSTGKIDVANFDKLVAKAAETPRFFGLAPHTSTPADRKAIFDAMDDTKTGHVTFDKFLKWTTKHVGLKLADVRAGKGYAP